MLVIKYLFFLFLLISNTSNLVLAGASIKTEHKSVVLELHNALVNSMKQAQTIDLQSRYKQLEPVIQNVFHISTMAKITTSYFWAKAGEDQRTNLVSEFTRLTAATYASQFSKYSGETFKIQSEKLGPQKTILVKSLIIRPGKKNVVVVYVLKKIKEKLGIIDILLDIGISELAKKRSEYHRILSTDGLPGLISSLKTKTENILNN